MRVVRTLRYTSVITLINGKKHSAMRRSFLPCDSHSPETNLHHAPERIDRSADEQQLHHQIRECMSLLRSPQDKIQQDAVDDNPLSACRQRVSLFTRGLLSRWTSKAHERFWAPHRPRPRRTTSCPRAKPSHRQPRTTDIAMLARCRRVFARSHTFDISSFDSSNGRRWHLSGPGAAQIVSWVSALETQWRMQAADQRSPLPSKHQIFCFSAPTSVCLLPTRQ